MIPGAAAPQAAARRPDTINDPAAQSDERLAALGAWLVEELGLAVESIAPASEDASFRRYFRVWLRDGATSPLLPAQTHTAIVMDAPPDREDCGPFVQVAGDLESMGLPAPRVYARELDAGFLLLGDLGDRSLLAALRDAPGSADRYYAEAGAMLHRLQAAPAERLAALPPYDEALLRRELGLFRDWLCGTHLDLDWGSGDERAWRLLCDQLVRNALEQPAVYVHRDYHSRNLMVTADGGLAMIDFQDAVRGPVTYDLVSLLRDCYIGWPLARVRAWALDWFEASPACRGVDTESCLRWFFLTGVQRQLKAAGIFARLAHRDDKWHYLPDVPRTLGYILEIAPSFNELSWLAGLIEDRCLPGLAAA